MKPVLWIALIMPAMFGGGCLSPDIHQAYPGAPLPAEQTCTLLVPAMLDVRSIDGVPTDWSLRLKKGGMQELSMIPGRHRLLVRYYDPTADESRQEVYQEDRIDVLLDANPGSAHELKYDTWTYNPELRKAREKVRVWVMEISPGVPAAVPRVPVAEEPVTGRADVPAVGSTRMDALKSQWNTLTPPERDSFQKWQQTQP